MFFTCNFQKKHSQKWSISKSKTTRKQWRHQFHHHRYMGVFKRCLRADNSMVGSPVPPKLELLLDIMHVLFTYEFKMDLLNSNREKSGNINFLDTQGLGLGLRLCNQWSILAEFRTHLSSYVCHHYLQV